MPIGTSYTAGHYNATWNALAVGKTDDGFNIEVTHKGEILRFEEFGDAIIDLVMRGAEVTVEAVLKDWQAAAMYGLIWPHTATPTTDMGKIDCFGNFAVKGGPAAPLVLTAEACTDAGQVGGPLGPQTFTFHKTIIHPDVAISINLNNKPRLVPIRMMCFLTEVTSANYRLYTIT